MLKGSAIARGLRRGEEGWIDEAQGILQSSETILYDALMFLSNDNWYLIVYVWVS